MTDEAKKSDDLRASHERHLSKPKTKLAEHATKLGDVHALTSVKADRLDKHEARSYIIDHAELTTRARNTYNALHRHSFSSFGDKAETENVLADLGSLDKKQLKALEKIYGEQFGNGRGNSALASDLKQFLDATSDSQPMPHQGNHWNNNNSAHDIQRLQGSLKVDNLNTASAVAEEFRQSQNSPDQNLQAKTFSQATEITRNFLNVIANNTTSSFSPKVGEADSAQKYRAHRPAVRDDVAPPTPADSAGTDAPAAITDQPKSTSHKTPVESRLCDWAKAKLEEPERHEFEDDMEQFKKRAKHDNVPSDQIAETFNQIERLTLSHGDTTLSNLETQHLAQRIMQQAADPTSISQGDYNTCNVTTVETRTYTRSPGDAARLVADVALTGQYRAADGTTVKIDATPHGQSHDWPTPDGERSHASEIFEVTAVNIHYAKQNAKDGGDIYYKQIEPRPGDDGDNGERLVDGEKWFSFSDIGRTPGLPDDTLTEISNAITGKSEKDVQIEARDYVDGSAANMLVVKNVKGLRENLKELKAQHKLPVIVKVNCISEPFYTDSGEASAGGSGGAHVVTITDYDARTGNVCIENQWGKQVNHDESNPVNATQLFIAMSDTDVAERISSRLVNWNRKHGTVDPVRELELLRYQKVCGDLSDDQFAANLHKAVGELGKQRHKGGVSNEEEARENQEVAKLICTLPAEAQIGLLEAARDGSLMDDQGYLSGLAIIGYQFAHENAHAPRILGFNPEADQDYSKKLTILKAALSKVSPVGQKEVLDAIASLMKKYP